MCCAPFGGLWNLEPGTVVEGCCRENSNCNFAICSMDIFEIT